MPIPTMTQEEAQAFYESRGSSRACADYWGLCDMAAWHRLKRLGVRMRPASGAAHRGRKLGPYRPRRDREGR